MDARTNLGFSAFCAVLSGNTSSLKKFAGYQDLLPTIRNTIERWTSCAAPRGSDSQDQACKIKELRRPKIQISSARKDGWSGGAYVRRSHGRFCWLLGVPARPDLPGEGACTQELNFDCTAMSLPSRRN